MVQQLWKTVWWCLKNLKKKLPYDPATSPVGIFPRMKSKTMKSICATMFTVALFAIAKRWKQLKCLSMDELTNNMVYTYNGEVFIGRNFCHMLQHI